ncbi:MAG TPA: hypothetical protein VL944_00290 [Candidatus Acidoferrum sp.]|nr:hypothetical protein [Candidatus Acidoferrum sp.]
MDMISSMHLKEGDELDFLEHDNYYIVAKKSAVADMIVGKAAPVQAQSTQRVPNERELALLKKLDTLRYNERTKEKVNSMLNAEEKKTIADLLKKRFVTLFKKAGDNFYKYGIPKDIYDNFLMRKKPQVEVKAPEQKTQAPKPAPTQQKRWEQSGKPENLYLTALETNGYLVIGSETEASAASSALEESIRRGLVVGVRAFNKKFYVATKVFITKSLPKIGKMIGAKSISVSEIAKETGVDEDGVRAVLYIMADNGDVTEIRRDVFKAA